LKLREAVVGLIVAALAIGIFLGAIYAMGPGSSATDEGTPPPGAQPAPGLDEDADAGG
jgi:hypothetical protein